MSRVIFFIFLFILLLSVKTGKYIFPNSKIAKITIFCDNTSAINIDKYVVYPIGELLLSIKEVREIEQFSYMGKAVIYVYFYKKYQNSEILFEKLRRKLDETQHIIPKNSKIAIDDKLMESYLVLIGISGENISYEKLYDTAIKIKYDLSNSKRRRIDVIGKKKEVLYIYFKNSVLSELKLTLDEICEFVKNANPIYKTSFFDTGKNLIQIQAENEFKNKSDIESVVVYLNERPLLLKNIFNIEKTTIEPEIYNVSVNGKDGLVLGIYPNGIFDIASIKDIKNEIFELKKRYKNVDIDILFFNFLNLGKNIFEIKLYLNENTNINEAKKAVKKIEDFLKEQKNVLSISSYIGINAPKYNKINIQDNNTTNEVSIIVNIKNKDTKKIKNFIDKNILNAQYIIKEVDEKPFQIRIMGNNTDELFMYSKIVENILKEEKNINFIKNDWGNKISYYSISVSENAANLAGVNPYILFDYLNTYYNGKKITEYYRGEVKIPIIIKGYDTKANPSNISFYSKNANSTIPIDQIARIDSDFTYSKIIRRNNLYVLTINGQTKNKIMKYITILSINSKLKKIKGLKYEIIKK